MNDLELREQFARWAAPLRAATAPDMTAIRRRLRRRRVRTVATACAALSCVLAGSVIALLSASGHTGSVPPLRHVHRPIPSPQDVFGRGRYAAPKTAPYIVLNDNGLRVIDAASGRMLGHEAGTFTDIAPEAGGRTFIALEQTGTGRSSFDQLSVRAGRVSITRIMNGAGLPLSYQPYGMTVNPEGTLVAVISAPNGTIAPVWLSVYSLRTGAVVDKLNEGSAQVTLQYWPSATQLAFSYVNNNGSAGDDLRILDTSTGAPTGSSLVAASAPDPRVRRYASAELSADGSEEIEIDQSGSNAVLRQYSVATGRLLHAVTIGTGGALTQSGNVCGVLWASANGADLLTQCGPRQLEIIDGRATTGRFAAVIPQSLVGWADSYAW